MSNHDRPIKMFVGVIAAGLLMSLAIPFITISLREGSVAPAAGWVVETTGVIGALLGCAILSALLRLFRRGRLKHPSSLPPANDENRRAIGTYDIRMNQPRASLACPGCGSTDWHLRGCPELRRKQLRFAPLVVVLIVVALGLNLLSSGSIGPISGWLDGMVGAVIGCLAFAAFIRWRRSAKSREQQKEDVDPPGGPGDPRRG